MAPFCQYHHGIPVDGNGVPGIALWVTQPPKISLILRSRLRGDVDECYRDVMTTENPNLPVQLLGRPVRLAL